jgi:hypothetical protein
MSGPNGLASIAMACLMSVGLGDMAPAALGAPASHPVVGLAENARNDMIEIKARSRTSWPNLPIAPSYRAYDWPYYFRRGHYPTAIGPGYVYYGFPYTYKSNRYGGKCSYWPAKSLRRAWIDARKCVGN